MAEYLISHKYSLRKVTSVLLAVLVSSFASLANPRTGPACTGSQSIQFGTIRIKTLDQSDKPVGGVHVELKSAGAVVAKGESNQNGEVEFSGLKPGAYDVVASREDLQDLTQEGIAVSPASPVQIVLSLGPRIEVKEAVTVKADGQADSVQQGASPPEELQRNQIKSLPSKPANVADALPLLPGVVRSPTGELKIAGRGENRSAFIVNSVDATDPATGQFGVTVPVDSVQVVNVFQTPYLAQFGRFTAGVVVVETRRGGDKWNYELNDPLPDFRILGGHLRGIRDTTPRVVFNGPLIENKLYFSEGFDYELRKTPVHTLPFPFNETKKESINSFTQLDYLVSDVQTLTGTFHFAPWHSNFVNLDFYNPQQVTPAFSAGDYTGTITDRYAIGKSLLESGFSIKEFSGHVWAQGQADMIMTPVGNSGSYFSEQHRDASRVEWLEIFSLAPIGEMGTHNLKFGTTLTRTSNTGQFVARPVDILDGAGNELKRVEFVNGRPFNRHDLETEFYGQDHWAITKKFSMDMGVRFDYQGITETFRIGPRVGVAFAPFGDQNTIIRGGYGIFYDRVPLSVYSFNSYPDQLITTFGPGGRIIDGPRLFVNLTESATRTKFPFIHSENTIGNFAPYSRTWNAQVDQPISKRLRLRANFLQSYSYGVVILNPMVIDGRNALVLGGGGKSQYWQVEFTARLSLPNDGQFFFSYVRSHTQGDINEFNNYLGNFPFPLVRPDVVSNLPGDLPNRFLAWGSIRLPWRMRVAPIAEYRNGFPYAPVDALQNYVGTPNKVRFPNFYSLDARLSKDFKVTDKYTLRLSVNGFNLTNHFNPIAIRSNIADSQYGIFFGDYKRRFTADFDIIF
jgi:hypothetical protein